MVGPSSAPRLPRTQAAGPPRGCAAGGERYATGSSGSCRSPSPPDPGRGRPACPRARHDRLPVGVAHLGDGNDRRVPVRIADREVFCEASIQSAGAVFVNSGFFQAEVRAAGTPASRAFSWLALESAHWMKYQAAPGCLEAWFTDRPHTSTTGFRPAGRRGGAHSRRCCAPRRWPAWGPP